MKAILCHKVGPLVSFCVLVFSASEKLVGQQRGLEPSDYYDMVSVGDVEISPEVDQISISINSDEFDPNSVQKVLNKWEINFQKEWEEEIIASSEF